MKDKATPHRADSAQGHADFPPFLGRDSGPERTPYCCTFHWFRLPDGRIAGVDVIRSSDLDQLSLRAYLIEPDGSIRGLSYAAPTADWEPFSTEDRPPLGGPRPSLGRGINWIAGSLATGGQPINRVAFDLTVVPESRALSSSKLWDLNLVYLAATDFTVARTTGWLELDGTRYTIDSRGPVSVHFGARVPYYGYCATVQDPSLPDASSLLLASVAGDNIQLLGERFRDITFTYAYGDGGVPRRMYNIGRFGQRRIPVDLLGHLDLSDIRPFAHQMLGVTAITATARATLHLPLRRTLPLGRVILDLRGSVFTDRFMEAELTRTK